MFLCKLTFIYSQSIQYIVISVLKLIISFHVFMRSRSLIRIYMLSIVWSSKSFNLGFSPAVQLRMKLLKSFAFAFRNVLERPEWVAYYIFWMTTNRTFWIIIHKRSDALTHSLYIQINFLQSSMQQFHLRDMSKDYRIILTIDVLEE